MSRARSAHADGRRKLSDDHRAKIAETNRRKYAELTPEQREAQLARIGRRPTGSGSPPPDDRPPAPERRSPLSMTIPELVRSIRGRG